MNLNGHASIYILCYIRENFRMFEEPQLYILGQIVSALAVDHTGSRVLSGSYDYTVRMYDFQGMNARLQSFRQVEPFEGHQVRSLSWSPTSDRFLCVTGSAQLKVCQFTNCTCTFSFSGNEMLGVTDLFL